MSGESMKKSSTRRGYDFRKGVRGKYVAGLVLSPNVVVLAPDVAKSFPTSLAVNRALRGVLKRRRSG
jgi:hypothetical protein